MVKADPERFILDNTAILAPPHVPEIRLHLASEAHDLWLKTEEELEEIGLPPPFWAFAWAGGQGLARYVARPSRGGGPAAASSIWRRARPCGHRRAPCRGGRRDGLRYRSLGGTAVRLNAALNGTDLVFCGEDQVGQPLDADVLLAGMSSTTRALPIFSCRGLRR